MQSPHLNVPQNFLGEMPRRRTRVNGCVPKHLSSEKEPPGRAIGPPAGVGLHPPLGRATGGPAARTLFRGLRRATSGSLERGGDVTAETGSR